MTSLPQHSENVEEELHRIELALKTIYSPSSSSSPNLSNPSNQQWWEQRQLADRYLTSFQGTEVSWMVCDCILRETDAPLNPLQQQLEQQQRRFFAAQTLHTKCRTDAYQLPASSLPSLRDSLVNNLNRYTAVGNMALTNRLAMCISALSVQMAWSTIVNDLMQSSAQNSTLVLHVLKVLPEECASDRLILVDENFRFQMRDHLVASSAMVFKFLETSNCPPTTIYEVFRSWIRYVPVQAHVIMASPLLEATIRNLVEPAHLELASDVLVEILRMYPSHVPQNQGLVQRMIPMLSSLPFDQAIRSEDEDVLRAYCRIITEMGESYLSLILSVQDTQASSIVDWVLRCSAIAETEIASITLHFWYRMVLDLESVDPYDVRQELVDRYATQLLNLIDICTSSLMKYPEDYNDLAPDRVDDLERDRFYVSETVEDCCRLLGGQIVLQRLGHLLQTEGNRVGANINSNWQGIESCFACILAANRFVASDEADVLPFCFALIPRLPADVEPLRYTTSKMIGKFASWLSEHPQILQPLMPYLAQGLSIKTCAPAAAVAIKELCECSNQKMSMGEPVLQLYNEISAKPGSLDLKDELEVLEGACRAASRQFRETQDNIAAFVQRIAQPIGARLAASLSNESCNVRQHVIPEIERLTVIVRFLAIPSTQPPHPIIELIKSSWALLHAASNRFPLSTDLAEKICRLHKHTLRAVGPVAYAPMLDALMEELVRSFERSRQSPFLYAASICVSEYGRDPSCARKLFDMVSALAAAAFTFLRDLNDLTHHPDVVEEFFYLMGRMVSYSPDLLVASPLLPSLFQCAIVGMQLEHKDANKGTLNFLENTITFGLSLRERSQPQCQQSLGQVLLSEGPGIVRNLILSLIGDLPAYSIDRGHGSISGILWKLNMLLPPQTLQWAKASLANVPEQICAEFLTALNRPLDSGLARQDFDGVVLRFMDACLRHRKLQKRRP
ncbi:unnamed protein product [Cylindrotheca closterium]|uniref:Exportin-1/Importin-beta-like domain-containing protein n=1 Tax=Cylindrotheca closterium TaxID=2856 RepID=A0AAD2JNG0_9STRA|nr:unnamed protein product [Cylindrotheca closterium]